MNMKRRNVDCSKLRRPLKRNKITEGIYGSTFLYVKFLMVWMLVLMADFVLDFRFEYLWPFWLLLRSVYDSYKYQGLAFSVFFVCIAVTSDVICYLVIPVQWLFFAASTYVWVQYVWHTERGICLPTVSLWLLCVYIEASVRLRNVKPLPYHMDLCRPFAAHCIGYPVVTLGFGFKSYVSYRLRMRKQKEVEKENNFYIQLLQQALPLEQQQQIAADKHKALPSKSTEDVISNGTNSVSESTPTSTANTTQAAYSASSAAASKKSNALSSSSTAAAAAAASGTSPPSSSNSSSSSSSSSSSTTADNNRKNKANNLQQPADNDSGGGGGGGLTFIETLQPAKKSSGSSHHHTVNDFDEETMTQEHNAKAYKASSSAVTGGGGGGGGGGKSGSKMSNSKDKDKDKDKKGAKTTNQTYANNKDESISRLESDVKRLKADLQSSRNCEQELRSQINNYVISDKSMKSELYQLRQDNESLQSKLHNLVQSRQQDKQAVSILERKLTDIRKEKTQLETQLATERRAKKAEEAATARAVAMATAARTSGECSDSCKLRRREQEAELKQMVRELKLREEQYRHMEREAQALRQYKENQNETEVLMSALAAMQDKNSHLENSLSSETRVKLDLFSALGEAKRQIEIQQSMLNVRELEIADLKSKIAEVLALVPGNFANVACPPSPQNALGTPHFSESFAVTPPPSLSTSNNNSHHMNHSCGGSGGGGDDGGESHLAASSSLNPNASDYTPKI